MPVGPIIFGTRVLLTRTGSNSILLGIGHCPTYQGRRKLIEKMGQKVCIDSVQARNLSYLTLAR